MVSSLGQIIGDVLLLGIVILLVVFWPHIVADKPEDVPRYLDEQRRHARRVAKGLPLMFGVISLIAAAYNLLAIHNYVAATLFGLGGGGLLFVFSRLRRRWPGHRSDSDEPRRHPQ
jgi:di/tricarboxylate transporter